MDDETCACGAPRINGHCGNMAGAYGVEPVTMNVYSQVKVSPSDKMIKQLKKILEEQDGGSLQLIWGPDSDFEIIELDNEEMKNE